MLICAYLSSTLLTIIPALERYLRWLGAAYILWLALSILRASSEFKKTDQPPAAFGKGILLQVVNPKALVFGLTVYSTFLTALAHHFMYLALSAAAFSITTFCATSIWTLFGTFIKAKCHRYTTRLVINVVLALLLAYTAVKLSGLL